MDRTTPSCLRESVQCHGEPAKRCRAHLIPLPHACVCTTWSFLDHLPSSFSVDWCACRARCNMNALDNTEDTLTWPQTRSVPCSHWQPANQLTQPFQYTAQQHSNARQCERDVSYPMLVCLFICLYVCLNRAISMLRSCASAELKTPHIVIMNVCMRARIRLNIIPINSIVVSRIPCLHRATLWCAKLNTPHIMTMNVCMRASGLGDETSFWCHTRACFVDCLRASAPLAWDARALLSESPSLSLATLTVVVTSQLHEVRTQHVL